MNVPLEYRTHQNDQLFSHPTKHRPCCAWFVFDDRVNNVQKRFDQIHSLSQRCRMSTQASPTPGPHTLSVSFCFLESGAKLAVEKCPPYEQQYWDPLGQSQVDGLWKGHERTYKFRLVDLHSSPY